MTLTDNPRAVVGDNLPNVAAEMTEQLERDYAEFDKAVEAALEKARQQPNEARTDADAIAMGEVVKEIRDNFRRGDAYREAEGQPHFRRKQAIDAYFFSRMEKLARRNPRDRSQRAGAADILQARIDDYLERKRIAEEERRRAEAAQAAAEAAERDRVARETARKAEAERRAAEEAATAADRARKAENIAARKAEAEAAAKAAAVAQEAAAAALVESRVAAEAAQGAHIATLAKPADMSRTRGDGVLLTQARQPYALVTDRSKLDREKLWPFFTDAEIEKALRGWAKTTGHNQQMEGAEIGHQRKGQTR